MDDMWCGMAWQNVSSNEEGMEVLASIPNLDKRVANFMVWLIEEPCTNGKHCSVMSNSRMCPSCRLRLSFFHTVFNGGAYDSSLDNDGTRP
jgi:hypothetical protein